MVNSLLQKLVGIAMVTMLVKVKIVYGKLVNWKRRHQHRYQIQRPLQPIFLILISVIKIILVHRVKLQENVVATGVGAVPIICIAKKRTV